MEMFVHRKSDPVATALGSVFVDPQCKFISLSTSDFANRLPRLRLFVQSQVRESALSLTYLDRKDVSRPKHVGAEDNPLHIWSECNVRLETIVMFGQVD
jgi:hypothetical protein